MERCPRCSEAVEAGWAYCPTCGRSRILESLRTPSTTPEWQYKVLRALIAVMTVWLTVTLGVAFLREAKAVREARQLLEQGDPQGAWMRLAPFLTEHPEHEQALFLCAKANFLLPEGLAKAGECFKKVQAESPKLGATLKQDFGSAVAAKSLTLGCDPEGFNALSGLAEEVGAPDPREVSKGLSGVILSCNQASQTEGLSEIAAFLAARNRALEMVELGYVPLIEQAENSWQARALAQQAVTLVPESEETVDAALERRSGG